jgi:hypothetical protein
MGQYSSNCPKARMREDIRVAFYNRGNSEVGTRELSPTSKVM